MTTLPNLSVIIPCYNEEKYIGQCLESLLANSYPQDRLEIWVVDGMSPDNTRAIVGQYQKKYRFIHIADNADRHIPAGLNIGIRTPKETWSSGWMRILLMHKIISKGAPIW